MRHGISTLLVSAIVFSRHAASEICQANGTEQSNEASDGVVLLQRSATMQRTQWSSDHDPVSVAVDVFAQTFNRHDFNYIDQVLDENFQGIAPMPGMPATASGFKYAVHLMLVGFADLHLVMHSGYAIEPKTDGTLVSSVFTWSGTHTGKFLNLEATNQKVEVSGLVFLFVSPSGKLTQMMVHQDLRGLLRQLEAGETCRDVEGTYLMSDGTTSEIAQQACKITVSNRNHFATPIQGEVHGNSVILPGVGNGTFDREDVHSAIVYANGAIWNKLSKVTAEEVLTGFVTMVLNQHRPELVDLFTVPEFRGIAPMPGLTADRQGFKDAFSTLMSGFPDLRLALIQSGTTALEDVTVLRSSFRWKGTQQAEFMNYPATGRSVDMTGFFVLLFEKGKIVSMVMHQDIGHLKESLVGNVRGTIPSNFIG